MTIYEIKERTKDKAPYFFSPKTLKFFGQTLKSFKVYKVNENEYEITAPMRDSSSRLMGTTRRIFNTLTNELSN